MADDDLNVLIPSVDESEDQFILRSLPTGASRRDPHAAAMDLVSRNMPDVLHHLVQIATCPAPRGRQVTAKLAACKLILDWDSKNRPAEEDAAEGRRAEHKQAILDLVKNHPRGQKILQQLREMRDQNEETDSSPTVEPVVAALPEPMEATG